MNVLFVYATFPDAETARSASRIVTEERLAACGLFLPGAESVYRWKGNIETASEAVCFFKTTEDRYPELEARLRALHPYETPCITAMPVTRGFAPYLDWVRAETSHEE